MPGLHSICVPSAFSVWAAVITLLTKGGGHSMVKDGSEGPQHALQSASAGGTCQLCGRLTAWIGRCMYL